MMPGAGAVARVVAGGLTRRRVQSLVIGLVLLVSTGACVLALALVADSSAPFDRAFAAQRGADVVASVDRAVALVAGLLAVPAGVAVHRYVLPVMAHAAGTGVPASYLAGYQAWEIAALALAGLVIAAGGGMVPAAWAARARPLVALHAE
jgi:hypothetical protein